MPYKHLAALTPLAAGKVYKKMSDQRLVGLNQVEERQRSFLWEGRIVLGGLTLLDGDPGKGKSSIIYDIAARVTTGQCMPLSTRSGRQPAGVVLLQGEDSLSQDVRPSLRAAGANLDRVIAYDRSSDRGNPITFPSGVSILEEIVQETGAQLVVIDPIACFLEGNMNSDQSVRKALGPLAELADRHNIAVVLVRHLTKSGRVNPLYRGAGSIGIIGAARSGLIVGDDPSCDDKYQHVLAHYKGNRGSAGSVAYRTVRHGDGMIGIQWLGSSDCEADDIIIGGPKHERTALQEAIEVLAEILSDGPLPANEVVRLTGEAQVSKRTLMRAKSTLKVTSQKVGGGPNVRWLWELPERIDLLMDRLINGPASPRPRRDIITPGRDIIRNRRSSP